MRKRSLLLIALAITGWPARAQAEVDFGFRLGVALGLAAGASYDDLTPPNDEGERGGRGGGSGLVGDLSGRLWAGHVVAGVTALDVETFLGPSESASVAGVGATFRPGPRLSILAEYGSHTVAGLGAGFLVSPISPSTVTLPCAGIRLGFDGRVGGPESPLSLGVTFFLLHDLRKQTQDVDVDEAFSGRRATRYRVGGTFGGLLFQVGFGFSNSPRPR
jgi:hypothetical protein